MPQILPQIYTVIVYICIGKLRDLPYIFAVIHGTPIYLHVHLLEYVLDEGGDENDEDTARPVQAQVDRRDGYYPTIRVADPDL